MSRIKKILHIEDEEMYQVAGARHVGRKRLWRVPAATGAEGYDCSETNHPDLLIGY